MASLHHDRDMTGSAILLKNEVNDDPLEDNQELDATCLESVSLNPALN